MRLDRNDLHELASLRRAHQALRFEYAALKRDVLIGKYNPDQPRVPAGQPGGGQFAGNNSARLIGEPVSPNAIGAGSDAQAIRDALPTGVDGGEGVQLAFAPAAPAAVAAMAEMLTMGLALLERMSRHNGPDSQAVLSINAREYNAATGTGLMLEAARSLNRDEVQAYCPRLGEVQGRTDRIAEDVATFMPGASAQRYGTAVHDRLAREIKSLDDPTLKVEVSSLKGDMANTRYGTKGSIRIDVLEDVNADTVCIYDIKTGVSGLHPARGAELAMETFKAFKKIPTRIIVTEIRPRR